jgi:nucleotide-binding universal stress UspA family protein
MERLQIRRILAAIDFSEESLAAWEQARDLADVFKAELEAVHAEPWQYSIAGFGPIEQPDSTRAVQEALDELRRRLGDDVPLVSLPGDPAETIVSHAVEGGFDLIVMSTHGRTGLSRLIQGSIAETVVRRSPIPVVVARRATRVIDSVLAPVNFLPYAEEGLWTAAQFARAAGATLRMLHVVSPPDVPSAEALGGIDRMLRRMAERLPLEIRRVVKPSAHIAFGDPAREIVSEAENHSFVALVAHRSRLLRDTVIGTTAERVLRHSRVPVLTVPTTKPEAVEGRRAYSRHGLRAPELSYYY